MTEYHVLGYKANTKNCFGGTAPILLEAHTGLVTGPQHGSKKKSWTNCNACMDACVLISLSRTVCQTSTDSCSAKFLLSEAKRRVLHTKLRFEYFGNCFMVLFIYLFIYFTFAVIYMRLLRTKEVASGEPQPLPLSPLVTETSPSLSFSSSSGVVGLEPGRSSLLSTSSILWSHGSR